MVKKDFAVLLIFSLFVLLIIQFTNQKSEANSINTDYEVLVDNTSDVVEDLSLVVPNLKEKYNNKDIVAELRISNTNYKTPVPQGSNNEYYLRRLADRSYGLNGSTYLDYRTKLDKSRVLIIYGHNSSKYDMPFKILENYYDEDYYEKHKYIELITSNGIKKYEVFSVYVETSDFSYYTDVEFENNKEFLNHINKLKNKSFYDTDVSLNENDNILILQACSTHKKYQKNKRKFVLIISREVKEDEINEENN